MSFTLNDYPASYFDEDPLDIFALHTNHGNVTHECEVKRVYPSIKEARATCVFPSNTFVRMINSDMHVYVVIETKSGVYFETGQFKGLLMLTANIHSYEVFPSLLIPKKGLRFRVSLLYSAVMDVSRMRANLDQREVQILSFQSGVFLLELLEDLDGTNLTPKLSIYDMEDNMKRFLLDGNLYSDVVFPQTDAYLVSFESLPILTSDATVKVRGRIVGQPSVVNQYKKGDLMIGTANVIEATPEYLVILSNAEFMHEDTLYLTVEGYEGRLYILRTSASHIEHQLIPTACEEYTSCTLCISPSQPRHEYELSVFLLDGTMQTLKYADISSFEQNMEVTTIYIPYVPSGFQSKLSFSLQNMKQVTTLQTLESIQELEVKFTQVEPEQIPIQVHTEQPVISLYGAGLQQFPSSQAFYFRPTAGNKQIQLHLVKSRQNGILAYRGRLSVENCLYAYTCYKNYYLVSPTTNLPEGHSAVIQFTSIEPTDVLHRVYFETSIQKPSDATLTNMMKDLSRLSKECINAQFSIYQAIVSIGGTWLDISVTNSNDSCFAMLLEAFQDPHSTYYTSLRLTGRSAGGHAQMECPNMQPMFFRRDCSVPDEDYYIPMPIPVNPDDMPTNKVNKHNYIAFFFCAFLVVIICVAGGQYFGRICKKPVKSKNDVYNRLT